MKLTITETQPDDYGDGENLEIRLSVNPRDDLVKVVEMNFGHGEPEDNYLFRDLSDAYHIEDAIVEAYEAGKRGEELEIEKLEGDK